MINNQETEAIELEDIVSPGLHHKAITSCNLLNALARIKDVKVRVLIATNPTTIAMYTLKWVVAFENGTYELSVLELPETILLKSPIPIELAI